MNITGKVVERCVYVGHERRPVGKGLVVVDDGSGVCKVDICWPHAAPWIVYENKAHLRVVETDPQ